jgi:hypothetical protein
MSEKKDTQIVYECTFSSHDGKQNQWLQLNIIKNGQTENYIEFLCREENGKHPCDRRVVRMFERVLTGLQDHKYTANEQLFRQMKTQMYEMVDEYWGYCAQDRATIDTHELKLMK